MMMPEMDGEELGRRIKADPTWPACTARHDDVHGPPRRRQPPGAARVRRVPDQARQAVAALRLPGGRAEPRRPACGRAARIVTRHSLADREKRSLRILLAEDNAINQKVALRTLERLGYHAEVVEDGQAALDALGARRFDLVLMDVQMPVLDGMAATRAHPRPGLGRARPLRARRRPDRSRAAGGQDGLPRRRHGRLPLQAPPAGQARRRARALGAGSRRRSGRRRPWGTRCRLPRRGNSGLRPGGPAGPARRGRRLRRGDPR